MNDRMKRTIIAITCLIMAISCAKKEDSGYVGPSEIQIENGVMTPETLLALGRLSDPQLSPDGSKILYGVSYTRRTAAAATCSCAIPTAPARYS